MSNKLSALKKCFQKPSMLFFILAKSGLFKNADDRKYIEKSYKIRLGETPDLDSPRTFNEKIQWIKLFCHDPRYTDRADKLKAKEIITAAIGPEHVIGTLGVWDSADKIEWDTLPDKFVLKCNHDTASIVVCTDKKSFDRKKAVKKLNKALKTNHFYYAREWAYKNVVPKVFAEEYISDGSSCLTDYKFFCFNGESKIMYCSRDLSSSPETDFYDMDFTKLDLRMKDKNSVAGYPKPVCFSEMKEAATKLSQGFPFMRVDFYEANGKMFVGELTFYPCAGFAPITPPEMSETLGDLIHLPEKDKKE